MATDNNNNNNNTLHANYFLKGMNSDVSSELIDPQQYKYALNLRISSYTAINEALNPNNASGAVCPVEKGITYDGIGIIGAQILATNSIDNIGIVITAEEDKGLGKPWHIYRVVLNDGVPVFTEICKNIKDKYTNKNRFTTVITYDQEDCIKLFIADGIHPIIVINIHEDNIDYLQSLTTVDQIIDRYMFPWEQPTLYEKITGTLPVSVIQYSYRFFKKNGICSKISPASHRFYTMNYTKDTEAGNKNGTSTNIGYRLQIPLEQDGVDFSKVFDHCQLFRIQQGGKTENTENDSKDDETDTANSKKNAEGGNDTEESREGAETPIKVFLVQEFQLPKNDKVLRVEDTGMSALQEITLDEYATLTGETVTPKYISYLQKNLFAANIKDTTVIEDDSLFLKSHTFSCDYTNNVCLYDPVTKQNYHGSYADVIKNDSVLEQYYLPNDYDINASQHNHIKLYEDGNKRIAGGKSKWVTWRMVTAQTPLWATNDDTSKYKGVFVGKHGTNLQYVTVREDSNVFDFRQGRYSGVNTDTVLYKSGNPIETLSHTNWQDPLYAGTFKSLRRDEVYRYGIIYYTKYGQRTDVQWIADIKTPTLQEVPIAYTAIGIQWTISIGLEFEVNCDDDRFKYYQIVRCPKNKQWSKNMYQVVCAHPMKHTTPSILSSTVTDTGGNTSIGTQEAGAGRYSPWLPNPYAIDQYIQYINTYWAKNDDYVDIWSGFYGSNQKAQKNTYLPSPGENYLVQMFSEDINVNEDDVFDTLAGSNCWLKRAYTYNGLNYFNFNKSLSEFKDNPQYGFIKQCLEEDKDVIYSYMDVKQRVRNQEFYNDYTPKLKDGRKFPNENWSTDHTRLNNGFVPGISAVLRGGTGFALTPSRYWDTCFYDAQITYLATGSLCNSEKPSFSITHYYDSITDNSVYVDDQPKILSVAKAKEPSWEDGFSNITMEGADVKSGSKTYKGHTSFVGGNTFCNWICSAMYDLRLSKNQSQYGVGIDYRHTNAGYYQKNDYADNETWFGDAMYCGVFTALSGNLDNESVVKSLGAAGWIGPGTRCIIAALSDRYRISRKTDALVWGCNEDFNNGEEDEMDVYVRKVTSAIEESSIIPAVTCSVTNIQHNASNFAGISRDQLQFDTYYSHGYWGKCNGEKIYVFDGDIFPTPVEITPIHKTYDFQSIGDTLASAQVNQFVLAESVYNCFFDYGYNFRNTQSDNIQLDVAQITGVCSQDRPQYKQNKVFAENNVTVESFTAANLEKSNDTFPVRIVYGTDDDIQTVDNRTLFKPNNYIDVGAENGPITNIDAKDNTLYFWQKNAFGKLAVNERSLVTDTNNNTIQLGQGGVLSRHDYLSQQYGMVEDTCNDIKVDSMIMWYDSLAHSLVSYGQNITDLGHTAGIQNLINSYEGSDTHRIYYDSQNKEIAIDEFNIDGNQSQLIFSTNNYFTSFHTRTFDDCLAINNICYLLNISNKTATQINYTNTREEYLKPLVLRFVVNNLPQYTKTFDTQQINTVSRYYKDNFTDSFMYTKQFIFKTSMQDETVATKDTLSVTDRECNIQYCVPRYNNEEYGNRLRGKWMEVTMIDNNPLLDYTISNILTNTRISFS